MATVKLCLLVVLLAAHIQSEPRPYVSTVRKNSSPKDQMGTTTSVGDVADVTTPLPCPDVDTVRKNNWPEDQEGTMTSVDARGITNIFWASYDPSSEYIDASSYVDVTYDETEQKIYLTALPSMPGVRDYPAMGYPLLSQLGGTVRMDCGSDTGQFDFRATVKDANTATPQFSAPTYTVDVPETFPNGSTIPGLVISASDADAEVGFYEVTFSLQGDTPFGLTETVKTGDVFPTYTTQLELTGPLDWNIADHYQLTVTALDPGGLSSEATVTVNVIDMDTKQPAFDQPVYTAAVDDPQDPKGLRAEATVNVYVIESTAAGAESAPSSSAGAESAPSSSAEAGPAPPSSAGTEPAHPSSAGVGPAPPSFAGAEAAPHSSVGAGHAPSSSAGVGPVPPSSAGAEAAPPSSVGVGPAPPFSAVAGPASPSSPGTGPAPPPSAGAEEGPEQSAGSPV